MHISIEPYVDIVGVTGSIPVTPTIFFSRKIHKYKCLVRILASCLYISISANIIKISADCRHSTDMKQPIQAGEYPPLFRDGVQMRKKLTNTVIAKLAVPVGNQSVKLFDADVGGLCVGHWWFHPT